ncbi:MAG: HlyC/CorC family transporter [Candidatus Hydrogenedentes bacterium]|nr:HlyC/CorC family transporter [Candidatus Hydrogenedentota bacterium]
MTLLLFSVACALFISFVCSLLEAALLSVTPSQVASLSARRPALGAIWRGFKSNIEKPIAVILITNTTAHTIGATIAGAQFEQLFGPRWLILFSIVLTYLMLQFTEILPKTLGVQYNGFLAPAIAAPLQVLVQITRPILWFIHLVNRPFDRKTALEDNTLEEIAALAATARLSHVIDPHQARMIVAASELEDIWVRQIMTPRTEVVFLRTSDPIEEVIKVLKKSPYTRLPLCEDDVDHAIGMVHVKDIIKALDLVPGRFHIERVAGKEHTTVEPVEVLPGMALHVLGSGTIDLMRLKRDVVFLPEHLNILQALRRFQDARLHLGLVVDEYGSTLGVVTLEDVIEEMVGDIKDEFDLFAPEMVHESEEGLRINGRFPLHELAHYLPDCGIDHTEEDVDTVGGYISQVMSRVPQAGENTVVGLYTWTVTSSDSRRVREILIARVNENGDTTEAGANGA